MSNVLVNDDRFNNVEQRLEKMKERATEFCQCRSNFQIEKFIACTEYTDATKFKHVSHNSYVTMQEVRRLLIDRERKLREIKRKSELMNNHKEYDYDLDVYELSRQLEDIDIRIKGLLKEVDYMEHICDELEHKNGKPFTAQQLDDEEPIYWERRLASQMFNSQQGAKWGIGEGNLQSYFNALETPVLPGSKNNINPIYYGNEQQLAALALGNKPGVKETHLIEVPKDQQN